MLLAGAVLFLGLLLVVFGYVARVILADDNTEVAEPAFLVPQVCVDAAVEGTEAMVLMNDTLTAYDSVLQAIGLPDEVPFRLAAYDLERVWEDAHDAQWAFLGLAAECELLAD